MTDQLEPRKDCPSDARLAAFMDNTATSPERDHMAEHVAGCQDCHDLVRETLQALDQDRQAASVVRGPLTRSRAAYLAIAASLIAGVLSYLLLRQRLDADRLAMKPLVDAVGQRRFFEPRLTGGFEYGPPVSMTRGNPDSEIWAVLGITAQLKAKAAAEPTVPHRSAYAAALLFAKDYDTSIDSLRGLTAATPDDARLWSNLAAAYLVRREANGQDADTAQALEAASRALELEPGLHEAAWNKALALERLGLTREARALAEKFRDLEPGGWAAAWDVLLARMAPAQRSEGRPRYGDAGAVRSVLATHADEMRTEFHSVLLPRVVRRLSVPAASVIAEAFLAQGDRYASDTLAWATSVQQSEGLAIVDRYVHAQRAYELNDFVAAEPLFAAALRERGPLALTSSLYLAIVEYWRSDFASARQRLLKVRSVAEERGYQFLHGRAEWMLGLIDIVEGRVFDGGGHYNRARQIFLALGDRMNAGAVSSLISEQARFTGMRALAWGEASLARKSLAEHATGRRTLVADLNLVWLAGDERLWRVAESAAVDAVAVVRQNRSDAELVEVLGYMALVQRRRGRMEESRHTFSEARAVVKRLPEGAIRDRMMAETAERQVDACQGSCTTSELDELRAALTYFSDSGRNLRVPALLLAAGLAAEQRGEAGFAEVSFREGARLLAISSSARQRIPLNAAAWEIFQKWAGLALARGELPKVLAVSELARRSARGQSVSVPETLKLPTPRSSLGEVLAFAVVGDELVGCLISRQGAACDREPAALFEKERDRYFVEDGEGLESAASGLPLLRKMLRSTPSTGILVIASDPFQPLLPPSVLFGSHAAERPIAYSSSIQSAVAYLDGPASRRSLPSRRLALLNAGVSAATLPGARAEVALLEKIPGAQLLTGAPEEQLADLSLLPEGTLIHFSGHARVNPDFPQMSALEFDQQGTPLRVTAADIAQHRLPPRSVVVLAGCDTAAWGGRRGPVTSLASSFVDAGAEIVISTTRPLPDAEAAACFPSLEAAIVRAGALEALSQAARTSAEPCRSLMGTVVAVVG